MTDHRDVELGQRSGSAWNEASETRTSSADQLAQATTSSTDSATQPDDQPVVKSELNETVIVDEDDLPNATGDQDSPGDLTPQFTTGTLEGSVGNDGPATFTLLDTGSPDGYTYKVVGDVLTVSDGSNPVLEVSLKDYAGQTVLLTLQVAPGKDGRGGVVMVEPRLVETAKLPATPATPGK